jgi:hypothetical protein
VEGVEEDEDDPEPLLALPDEEEDEPLLDGELPAACGVDAAAESELGAEAGAGGDPATGGAVAAAGGETASTSGPVALSAFVLATDPTTTPKASIPMIATAAARGEGMERDQMVEADVAAAGPAASAAASPRARSASMRSSIAAGKPPHRVPHSTQ